MVELEELLTFVIAFGVLRDGTPVFVCKFPFDLAADLQLLDHAEMLFRHHEELHRTLPPLRKAQHEGVLQELGDRVMTVALGHGIPIFAYHVEPRDGSDTFRVKHRQRLQVLQHAFRLVEGHRNENIFKNIFIRDSSVMKIFLKIF